MWGQFDFVLLSPTLVGSTPLGLPRQCGKGMHKHSTSDIRRRTKIRRWHSTRWHMTQCEGVSWLLWWFALMTKFRDVRERNVATRSEIWTTNIRSLGFRDIREWVPLWGLILRRLRCIEAGLASKWVEFDGPNKIIKVLLRQWIDIVSFGSHTHAPPRLKKHTDHKHISHINGMLPKVFSRSVRLQRFLVDTRAGSRGSQALNLLDIYASEVIGGRDPWVGPIPSLWLLYGCIRAT